VKVSVDYTRMNSNILWWRRQASPSKFIRVWGTVWWGYRRLLDESEVTNLRSTYRLRAGANVRGDEIEGDILPTVGGLSFLVCP